MRPSDIYKSRSGKFVEVVDTDAEGRLIMADALTYVMEMKADIIPDLATSTGASRLQWALRYQVFFQIILKFQIYYMKASNETGDPLWQLPLWQNYNNQILSKHADYKNLGNSGFYGQLYSFIFTKFVKTDIPWVHLDDGMD